MTKEIILLVIFIYWFVVCLRKKIASQFFAWFVCFVAHFMFAPFQVERGLIYGGIQLITAGFIFYEFYYKRHIEGSWRYALVLLIFGIGFLIEKLPLRSL